VERDGATTLDVNVRGRAVDRSANAALLALATGLPIVDAVAIESGFTNRTDRATLSDGRVVVVQRLADVALARARVRTLAGLTPRLRSLGVPVPDVVKSDPEASVPFVVTDFVPGANGLTALADHDRAIALAWAMGRLVPLVASVPTDGLRLPATWARPSDLARTAGRWLGRVEQLVTPDVRDELAARIDSLADAFAGRPAVLAHGDWARLVSRRGELRARAHVTDRVFPGLVWMALHFAEQKVNWLTHDVGDPLIGTPEYKVSAVRVEALREVGAAAR
jgi:hypothetical protein